MVGESAGFVSRVVSYTSPNTPGPDGAGRLPGWMLLVCCVGNFDGVHLGHQALIRRAREVADSTPGTRVIAMVFDPHPFSRVAPERTPARLSLYEQRRDWLLGAGADEAERLDPASGVLERTPEEFVDMLARRGVLAMVEGADFRFGARRAGDADALLRLGRARGMRVEILQPVHVALGDCTVVRASSTMLRWLVSNGRVGDAKRVAGRAYEAVGTVVRGDRMGRELGYPTANVETPCLPPADGVYAGRGELPDGRIVVAAISVGRKPTFDSDHRFVEAYFVGVDREASGAISGLPEYGWPVRLSFDSFIREQARFGSAGALVSQIERDVERVCDMLGRDHAITGVSEPVGAAS